MFYPEYDREFAHKMVTQARTWIGTSFHHQGRVKKTQQHHGGCDCLGLLVGIAMELKLRPREDKPQKRALLGAYDERLYGHRPDGKRLQTMLESLLYPIPQNQREEGDVLLMRFEDNPQHLGILTKQENGEYGVIHGYAGARKVVEHRLDAEWEARIVQIFRVQPPLNLERHAES